MNNYKFYKDKKIFDDTQLFQIKWGIEQGVDVEKFAKPELNSFEMQEIRKRLVKEKAEGKGNKMKIRVKYFNDNERLQKIVKGNWIDVRASEDVFIPTGSSAMIKLGFALELPKGYEGHLLPRSSTFKNYGCILVNGMGIIDDSYIGDNDEWCFPLYCLEPRGERVIEIGGHEFIEEGTWIRKGERIGQFRIMEVMQELELIEVEKLGNSNRGGFGTTGK